MNEDLREDGVYCSDTNFLIDYLDEDHPVSKDAKAFLEANVDREYYIPSITLFEVFRGGAQLRGAASVVDLIDQLN